MGQLPDSLQGKKKLVFYSPNSDGETMFSDNHISSPHFLNCRIEGTQSKYEQPLPTPTHLTAVIATTDVAKIADNP
jgi:hypothetical protein